MTSARPEGAVCFGLAVAASTIAKERNDDAFWRMARDAASIGDGLVSAGTMESAIFRFFALAAKEALAGREVGTELLFRVGLGAPLVERDPVDAIRESGAQLVPRFYRVAA
jgi:hypothetical protein